MNRHVFANLRVQSPKPVRLTCAAIVSQKHHAALANISIPGYHHPGRLYSCFDESDPICMMEQSTQASMRSDILPFKERSFVNGSGCVPTGASVLAID